MDDSRIPQKLFIIFAVDDGQLMASKSSVQDGLLAVYKREAE